jgi:colanic acid/amylovoran biosynthesis glycosyltransferase
MELAYLTSVYPGVSNTFVEREVRMLRAHGTRVETLSVRRGDADDVLSERHREALDSTWAIRPDGLSRLPLAHLRAFARSPRAYLRALALALRMSPGGARAMLWQGFYFVQAIALWDHLEPTPIRHVHVHFSNVAADVALLACAYGGPAWSWSMTIHGPTDFYNVDPLNLPEKIRRAGFVICIGDFCRSQVSRCVSPDHWDKLEIVHCGVDMVEFQAPEAAAARPSDRPLELLSVGRLAPDKGQPVLLRALAALGARGYDVRATLVGNGEERERLEALAAELGVADRVRLTGAVGQDEIHALYARADVFCLPSFAEGVPVVLMEAMAMQVPVVATTIMGVPELVEDGRTGLLVPPANVERLTDAIARLADDGGLRERLGRAGREKVADEFELGAVGERLLEVFRSRLGDAAPEPRSPLAELESVS